MSVTNFIAVPYNQGVKLSWNVGKGLSSSDSSDIAEVTIQYSTTGVANVTPNTPPYVVRELQQPQQSSNVIYHPYLTNDVPYIYTIFVHYLDSGIWYGPIITAAVTPKSSLGSPFSQGILSFSKLGLNTVLVSEKDSKTDITVWMHSNQQTRRGELKDVIELLKPAHVRTTLTYEQYFLAQTTTAQFLSGSYDTSVYDIKGGTITNKVPTINSAFSGKRAIYEG